MKHIAITILEYLLGFLALAVFAGIAFGAGPPNDERFVLAFKVASSVALVELVVLLARASPVDRLILSANLWLLAGGLAALSEQWWWLRGYRQLGEASLFLGMLAVGVVSTAFSSRGFVAASGPRRHVLWSSLLLLAAVGVALLAAVHFRGDVTLAAVVPVIVLSWLSRALRKSIERGPRSASIVPTGGRSVP